MVVRDGGGMDGGGSGAAPRKREVGQGGSAGLQPREAATMIFMGDDSVSGGDSRDGSENFSERRGTYSTGFGHRKNGLN